jgi:hypothetical protein
LIRSSNVILTARLDARSARKFTGLFRLPCSGRVIQAQAPAGAAVSGWRRFR